MTNQNSTKTLEIDSRFSAFEKARVAALTLLALKEVLTKSQLETLKLLLDQESLNQISKSLKEAKKGKLEPMESILK